MTEAVVVGAGPNGLTAAVELARAGVRVTVVEGAETIGGGCRTEELTLPGLRHDVCSAVHPTGIASPAFTDLELERHGLRWLHPPVGFAHVLDGGRVAVEGPDLAATAAGLGTDGPRWEAVLRPLVDRVDEVLADVMQPVLHVPDHPVDLVRFGVRALLPATTLARVWRTDEARALFAGMAAHAIQPLTQSFTAGVGLLLMAAGQAYGWPVAAGGSVAIVDALAAQLRELGGTIETGRWVRSLDELPRVDAVLLDTTPAAAVAIAGPAMHPRERRAFLAYRHGPGAFKVDLAVEGGIPWTAEPAHSAGTVHVGGTIEEIAASEAAVAAGHMPERPFVLVAQQHVADPSRSVGDVHPVWTYAHVPHGWSGDATEHVLRQLERFAPGVRDRVLATAVMGPDALAARNPNYIGGDIANGANDPVQALFRPRPTARPYRTTVPGLYLCSAATPPGGGVHGMCGRNAARAALADMGR